MTALKQKNTQLQDKQKDSMLQLITLKKEKDEALLISQQTDSKLSLALAKAEKVPALEIDLKDMTAKISSVQKQLDASQQEIDKLLKANSDLTKKLEEAKKVQAALPTPETLQ